MNEEEERARCQRYAEEWAIENNVAHPESQKVECLAEMLVHTRAEAFEAGRKDAMAEFIEGKTALEGTCRDLSTMLTACKSKLARVEALIVECDEGDDVRVDVDQLRAALADSGDKP